MLNCIFYRWKLSKSLDNNDSLSPRIQAHIDECESCREFYLTNSQVAKRLSESKLSLHANPERSRSIMAAIRHEAAQESLPRPQGAKLRWALPAIALATICIVVGWFMFRSSPTNEYQAEIDRVQADLLQLTKFVQNASEPMHSLLDD